MRRAVASLGVLLVLAIAAVAVFTLKPSPPIGESVQAKGAIADKYQCSMHPQIVSDKPGICPICQMKLSRVDDDSPASEFGNAPAPSAATTASKYQCSMHPQIVSDKPGICPICQMKLSRVEDDSPTTAAEADTPKSAAKVKFYRHPMRPDVVSPVPAKDEMGMDYLPVYDDESAATGGDVPGHASFSLSAERQQLIGVTTAAVERRDLQREIRANGRVAYDPGLYQAIVEYREAVRSQAAMRRSQFGEARAGSDAVVRGAQLRLRQQGLSETQIQELADGRDDPKELLLPGNSVWVYAQVYENEAPLVKPGQTMTVSATSHPGRPFTAVVKSIDPILDSMTRTVRVRGLVSTPAADLRPESFVEVTIRISLGSQVAVPSEAVLDTGEHQIVFVVEGGGKFEPRSIQVGHEAQGYYEVLSGLAEGEKVVTSANFLIDSESRFRSALAGFKNSAGDRR